MTERPINVFFKVSDEERESLDRKARKAGMSRAEFIRNAVAGKEIMEAPGADVALLIREVRRVGSMLDRILKSAESGEMEVCELEKALEENRAVEKKIYEEYLI